MPRPSLNIAGHRFGRLTVLRRADKNARNSRWLCRCSCGKKKIIRGNLLVTAQTKSCGCYSAEAASRRNVRHGHACGYRMSRTYLSWRAMLSRTTNKKHVAFKRYGAAGIKVCKRWLKFENFLADVGLRPIGKTLDRFPNPRGNYEPGNCRWATRLEQARNK